MREIQSRETIDAMRREAQRIVAAVAIVSGCSLGMKPVAPEWDGTEAPDCPDDRTPIILDSIGAGILIGIGAVGARVSLDAQDAGETSTGADVVAIGGLGGGLVLAIVALVGESKYKRCHEAHSQWRIGGAIGKSAVNNRSDENERRGPELQRAASEWCVGDACFPDRAACARHAGTTGASEGCVERRGKAAPAQEAPPRGFFCSSGAATGFCVRNKTECAKTRDVSIVAIPDLSECALVEKAWCLGERCFPNAEICAARVADAGVCAESE